MENKSVKSQRSKHLVAYFFFAYAISWAIGIPLALAKQRIIHPIFPEWLHYFVAYGPMLSALLITGATQGQQGIKELWGRIAKWHVGNNWWLVAVSPLIVGLALVVGVNLLTSNKMSVSELGEIHFLPPLGLGALFLWLVTFGIGEEIGWRGYALPRLQKDHNALYATFILTIGWAFWHMPQFFYVFDPSIAVGWFIGLFAGAIVFTWLVNSTEGSILIVAVFHGCFNYMSASASNTGNGLIAAVISTIVMVWAVVVVVLYKPQSLAHKGRFTIE